jgi:hypothetical protein
VHRTTFIFLSDGAEKDVGGKCIPRLEDRLAAAYDGGKIWVKCMGMGMELGTGRRGCVSRRGETRRYALAVGPGTPPSGVGGSEFSLVVIQSERRGGQDRGPFSRRFHVL